MGTKADENGIRKGEAGKENSEWKGRYAGSISVSNCRDLIADGRKVVSGFLCGFSSLPPGSYAFVLSGMRRLPDANKESVIPK